VLLALSAGSDAATRTPGEHVHRQPHGVMMADLSLHQCLDFTVAELVRLRERHAHWGVAWSGGKDSTALATVTAYAIEAKFVARPETLKLIRSDTRQELAPLDHAAAQLEREFAERGWDVVTVEPDQDKSLWVNILGRGVVPPNSMTARWCTRQLKQDPMAAHVRAWKAAIGGKPLMLIGLRTGESATRDRSMAVACTRDGGECGQGRFYFDLPDELTARTAPVVHWKTCKVWAWLKHYAPNHQYADAYGGQGESETESGKKAVRTGCVGCPLVPVDSALEAVVALPQWSYLSPLRGLSDVFRELREPRHRLRKRGYERNEGGELEVTERQRSGTIRLASRLYFLGRVLAIQGEVNAAARKLGRPEQWVIPPADEARIRELVAANTWPRGWDGTEPGADEPMHEVRRDGTIQLNLLADW
jgi:DNA sulfur modification protein DndC